MITHWAIWLRAALFYSKNLPAVRAIVNNWTGEDLLVRLAKKLLMRMVWCQTWFVLIDTGLEQLTSSY